MKFHPEKFLSPDKLEKKVNQWKSGVEEKEGEKFSYKVNRLDGGERSVSEVHGISFIKDVIPQLIKNKEKGEKVRILDIGAGAAFFTDEIRKAFPDDVKVFSTGLRKKTSKDYRKTNKLEGDNKLHHNDLKWRSILELSDFEEFDLIIDTFGELYYTMMQPDFDSLHPEDRAVEYLTAVIKKLKPGGLASIAPFGAVFGYLGPNAFYIMKELEDKYGVRITFSKGKPEISAKIDKIR